MFVRLAARYNLVDANSLNITVRFPGMGSFSENISLSDQRMNMYGIKRYMACKLNHVMRDENINIQYLC